MEFFIKENSWIAKLAARKLQTHNVAIVLGKTIHLYNVTKKEFLKNQKWVKHEIRHLQQFQQYGFLRFILMYLWEGMRKGYHNNKYEIEVRLEEEQ